MCRICDGDQVQLFSHLEIEEVDGLLTPSFYTLGTSSSFHYNNFKEFPEYPALFDVCPVKHIVGL